MATIASRLREALNIRGMKQIELSEKTGINKGAISSYLSGKYEPKQANVSSLAQVLSVNEAWLLGKDVPMDATIPAPALDSELGEYLEELKNRSEMRMLFQLAKGATKEDVEKAVRIIEALRQSE